MEEEHDLNEDLSNAVSKKCKHGVKTLVDTIVDQPCQYSQMVIMSQVLYGCIHSSIKIIKGD